MSSLLPIDVNGVQFQAQGEYTTSAVAQQYQNSLSAFVNIFNLGLPNTTVQGVNPNDPQSVVDKINSDSTYRTQLLNALIGGQVTLNYDGTGSQTPVTVLGLFPLLKSGMLVTNDPVLRPGQSYLSVEMAGAVDQLVRSLQMAGVNIQSDGSGGLQVVGGITDTMVSNWRNLAASSTAIQQILQYATDASGNQNRTLQALVELIYVKTGNDMLADTLDSLESALTITKNSMDALTNLQNLLNKVTADDKTKFQDAASLLYTQNAGAGPKGKGTDSFGAGQVDPTTFVRGFTNNAGGGINSAADAHFTPIDPTLLTMLTESDRIEFLSTRKDIISEIHALSGQTDQQQKGTLLDKLRTVLQDINKAFSAIGVSNSGIDSANATQVTSALTRWILDSTGANFTGLNIPGIDNGQIQRNLTAAISAGQSLNDTQKEEVRRYLFVFEEYYKSAASILTKITQLIERMAQAISR